MNSKLNNTKVKLIIIFNCNNNNYNNNNNNMSCGNYLNNSFINSLNNSSQNINLCGSILQKSNQIGLNSLKCSTNNSNNNNNNNNDNVHEKNVPCYFYKEVIRYLWYDTYTGLKWKLTLGLINKRTLQYVCEMNGYLNLSIVSDLQYSRCMNKMAQKEQSHQLQQCQQLIQIYQQSQVQIPSSPSQNTFLPSNHLTSSSSSIMTTTKPLKQIGVHKRILNKFCPLKKIESMVVTIHRFNLWFRSAIATHCYDKPLIDNNSNQPQQNNNQNNNQNNQNNSCVYDNCCQFKYSSSDEMKEEQEKIDQVLRSIGRNLKHIDLESNFTHAHDQSMDLVWKLLPYCTQLESIKLKLLDSFDYFSYLPLNLPTLKSFTVQFHHNVIVTQQLIQYLQCICRGLVYFNVGYSDFGSDISYSILPLLTSCKFPRLETLVLCGMTIRCPNKFFKQIAQLPRLKSLKIKFLGFDTDEDNFNKAFTNFIDGNDSLGLVIPPFEVDQNILSVFARKSNIHTLEISPGKYLPSFNPALKKLRLLGDEYPPSTIYSFCKLNMGSNITSLSISIRCLSKIVNNCNIDDDEEDEDEGDDEDVNFKDNQSSEQKNQQCNQQINNTLAMEAFLNYIQHNKKLNHLEILNVDPTIAIPTFKAIELNQSIQYLDIQLLQVSKDQNNNNNQHNQCIDTSMEEDKMDVIYEYCQIKLLSSLFSHLNKNRSVVYLIVWLDNVNPLPDQYERYQFKITKQIDNNIYFSRA